MWGVGEDDTKGRARLLTTCIHPNCQETTDFLTSFCTIWVFKKDKLNLECI